MNEVRRSPPALAPTALAIALASNACTTISAEDEAPAVLKADIVSHAELVKTVQQALHRTDITLADDALTQDSELIIGQAQPRDGQGRYLNGRDLGKPDHFRLIMHGSTCVLVHIETNERWTMRDPSCMRKKIGD